MDSHPETHNTYEANAFEEDRKKALAKGMNGHIAKPVDAEKLKKTILSALR